LTVERMCTLAGVSRSGFYRFPPDPAGPDRNMKLRDALQRIALEFPSYGWPRMTAELRRRGWVVNHKRVYRLMRQDNLLCLRRRRFVVTTDSGHGLPVYPNLARTLTLSGLDQLWVADITYIRLEMEFVYLAVILDAFSRRVIGWALDRTLEAALTLQALHMALARPWGGTGASLRSRRAICFRRLREDAAKTRDDSEHEPAGKSLRQCQLRKLHEDSEA
jgi:putative transposase